MISCNCDTTSSLYGYLDEYHAFFQCQLIAWLRYQQFQNCLKCFQRVRWLGILRTPVQPSSFATYSPWIEFVTGPSNHNPLTALVTAAPTSSIAPLPGLHTSPLMASFENGKPLASSLRFPLCHLFSGPVGLQFH